MIEQWSSDIVGIVQDFTKKGKSTTSLGTILAKQPRFFCENYMVISHLRLTEDEIKLDKLQPLFPYPKPLIVNP